MRLRNEDSGTNKIKFDISLSANIDGDNVDLVVEYREPHVQQHVAVEACSVLLAAVNYLLQSTAVPDPLSTVSYDITLTEPVSVFDGFYQQMVGTDEATTTTFWKDQLKGTIGGHFPVPPNDPEQVREYKEVAFFQKTGTHVENDNLVVAAIRAAWSVLAARMLDSTEAICGAVTKDGALLPIRISLDWEQDAAEFLQSVQTQTQNLEVFQNTGLQRIRRVSGDAALASDFQTILSISNDCESQIESLHSFAILLKYNKSQVGSHVNIKFDSKVLSENQVMRLFYQFEHVHQQLLGLAGRTLKLKDISIISKKDTQAIWGWNSVVPESIMDNVPHMIREAVLRQPSAAAIDAWDGSLTYQELEDLSSTLAYQLGKGGVSTGDAVLLCFEKSMWMPVAAMAVMKAGASCVATDPSSQPEERLRAMASQVQAKTVLASVAWTDLALKLSVDNVITVGREDVFESAMSLNEEPCLPGISPSDILYINFTSGSTGNPKGAMVTHGNFCSAITHQRDLLGFKSDSRVLDFSSYAFDVAWSNMLNTLTAGGCLCIPSAEERQDSIAGCLEKYGITVSDLTPSVLRSMEPKTPLAQLSTMLLGGEVVLPSDAQYVREDALVVSAYGPAECTPTSMILHLTPHGDGGLGRAVGVCTWVAETDNPNKLAAIGEVGELWIEGPLVGAGYVNNPEKTSTSFVEDPDWLVQGIPGQRPGRHGRVYRTGDLVQYLEDGTLLFKGRKDTQVKIRGQRVELEEVEHFVQQVISASVPEQNVEVVAETIQPHGAKGIMLVAFVSLGSDEGMIDEEHGKAVRSATLGIVEQLAGRLPPFMIPAVYIPICKIPMTATGKTDRRQLRGYGSALTSTDIAALSRIDGERRAPTNDSERLMQGLWAEVLNLEPNNIGIDDSFFRIGGDSIGAMKLVGLARRSGLVLAVRDVFKRPIMRDLCALPLLG